MSIILEPEYLGHLWEALRDQIPRSTDTKLVQKRVAEIVDRGWAAKYMIEDLLCSMGAGWFFWPMNIHTMFGVPKRSVYARPRSGHDEVCGFEETAAADLAFALIQVERLGVAIDPSPLVEALRPGILKQDLVTSSELHVLWYKDERHKMQPVTLEKTRPPVHIDSKRTVLLTGYKADVWHDRDGSVGSVMVTPTKYRCSRKNA